MNLSLEPVQDHCTETGAKRLAARIERYWQAHGYMVRCKIIKEGYQVTMRGARADLRSDMINGWPRGMK